MVMDVSYWVNKECQSRSRARVEAAADTLRDTTKISPVSTACVNCAVEESCISQREVEGLLPHDKYIRDNITEEDVLVVDVGGNDVALRPTAGVIANMAWLLYLTPKIFIKQSPFLAPGLFYFIYMFRYRLRSYIESLTSVRKPR